MAVFAEMRRRNVFKVALLYLIGTWLVLWGVGALNEPLALPVWTGTFVLILLAVGFPVALWFAWTYEITPVGLKKASDVDQTQSIVYKTGQKLNAAVAVMLVLGVLAVFGQRLLPTYEFPVFGVPEGEPPASPQTPAEIRRLVLDNGLEIIVWPDHDIPNAVIYSFVRAGARNEHPGITGVSHFFEHMMFLGTARRAPGEFDKAMEAAGGSNNAYTNSDVTVYMDWFPRAALETIFDLEGDRFENLAIVPTSFNAEREVVFSERRTRVDNNNFLKLAEQVQATAYVAHPYQFPVLGWPSDIENWTQQDLVDYYRTYYAPNNRTITLVGDVTAEEIFALAEDAFGGAPAQEPPPPIRTIEPPQPGTRRVVVEAAAQTPLLQLAFHAMRAGDEDELPMRLLLGVLAGGESSRLHRLLVEETGLALSVESYQDAGFDPGLVWLLMTLPPGGDPDIVEVRVLEALRQVATEGVSEDELAKARNIELANYWRDMATIDGKAAALGHAAVFLGDYEKLFSRPDALAAVTVDDLRDVAARVFRAANMTVGVLRSPVADEASP